MKKNPAPATQRVLKKGEDRFSSRPAPGHFYKYKYIDEHHPEYSSRIFTHNELYFSSVNAFNDPFDCTYRVEWHGSSEEEKKYVDRVLKKFGPSLNRHERRSSVHEGTKIFSDLNFIKAAQESNRQETEKWGICCLSEIEYNILMWSHYANAHQGFCLQFLNENGQSFGVQRKPEDRRKKPDLLVPLQVRYSDTYPIVNCIGDNPKTMAEKTCLTKAENWKYEKEWRIVDLSGPGSHQFPSQFLTGVIFGCRMSEEHKKLIRDWCRNRDSAMKYYEANESKDSYSLNIVEIS